MENPIKYFRNKRKRRVLVMLDNYLHAWEKAMGKYGFGAGRLQPPHQELSIYEEVLKLRNKVADILWSMENIQYPADRIVQWPSGPVCTCEKHGNALINLGRMLGSNVVATKLHTPTECINCVNEADREHIWKNFVTICIAFW